LREQVTGVGRWIPPASADAAVLGLCSKLDMRGKGNIDTPL
jgi:hypothetical protein